MCEKGVWQITRIRNSKMYINVYFTLEQAMKTQKGSRYIALLFLQPRRSMRMCGQRQVLVALPPGNRLGTHCTGGWMGPRACLDGHRESRPYRHSIPDRPANSESLYRLHCLGPLQMY
jgi:hypothetical protein